MFGDLFGNMEEMQKQLRARLAEITVEVQAGDGAVRVTANGNREITNIAIDPERIDFSDKEALEDLLLVAVNKALEAAQTREAEEVQGQMRDMLPPGMDGLDDLFN